MLASGCEFELPLSSGDLEKGAVIAIMVLKPTGLMQTDQIPIERNDLIEPTGVPSDSHFHVEANPMPEHRQLDTDPAVLVMSIDLSVLHRQKLLEDRRHELRGIQTRIVGMPIKRE
jgi:hypothetical protein